MNWKKYGVIAGVLLLQLMSAAGLCAADKKPATAVSSAVDGAKTGEDGYDFWLRYRAIADTKLLNDYTAICQEVVVGEDTPVMKSAVSEITRGLNGLLGRKAGQGKDISQDGSVILCTLAGASALKVTLPEDQTKNLKPEGFLIRSVTVAGKKCTVIAGGSDRGVLYGVFHFLRLLQTSQSIVSLAVRDEPVMPLRMFDHWDNLDGSIERGYAGRSLFHWEKKDRDAAGLLYLPEIDPRLHDYGRMMASLGINAVVIHNVNSNPKILETDNLKKMAALANVFRQYGVVTYTTIAFGAPMRIGGLKTADPFDADVIKWWDEKTAEIYKLIPDFGGFLVKANCEGMSGPANYGRTIADGVHLLGKALRPHGGIVIWRTFGPQAGAFPKDDGKYEDNAVIQSKNGSYDFRPVEPVHWIFAKLPKTSQVLELEITQEYCGHSTELCYLVPMWKRVLDFDTYSKGEGSTIKRIVDGSLYGYKHSGMAGVVNVGMDRNWTGHHLAAANTYGFGRLAWNPDLTPEQITDEWVKMTFGSDPDVVKVVSQMLLKSWHAYLDYKAPNGWWHGPTNVDNAREAKPGDFKKIGGYARGYPLPAPAMKLWESVDTCPPELMLYFHAFALTDKMKSGKTFLQHMYDTSFDAAEEAKGFVDGWNSLKGKIDDQRHAHVLKRLQLHLDNVNLRRDIRNAYFFNVSGIPDEKGRPIGNQLLPAKMPAAEIKD